MIPELFIIKIIQNIPSSIIYFFNNVPAWSFPMETFNLFIFLSYGDSMGILGETFRAIIIPIS